MFLSGCLDKGKWKKVDGRSVMVEGGNAFFPFTGGFYPSTEASVKSTDGEMNSTDAGIYFTNEEMDSTGTLDPFSRVKQQCKF